jgi:Restriction endonuclease S subunits
MAVSGDVGVVSRLAVDACVHDGFVAFCALNESVVSPDFLLMSLHLLKVTHDKHKAGAIFLNLTTGDIKAMRIPIPPITVQKEYVNQASAVYNLGFTYRESLGKLDALFASLQHRAFRGEL